MEVLQGLPSILALVDSEAVAELPTPSSAARRLAAASMSPRTERVSADGSDRRVTWRLGITSRCTGAMGAMSLTAKQLSSR